MPVKRRLFKSAISILQKERQRDREREKRAVELSSAAAALSLLCRSAASVYISLPFIIRSFASVCFDSRFARLSAIFNLRLRILPAAFRLVS